MHLIKYTQLRFGSFYYMMQGIESDDIDFFDDLSFEIENGSTASVGCDVFQMSP